MAENVQVCELKDGLKERLKKFRFRKEKTNAAIIMKVDKDAQLVEEDDSFEDDELADISIEDLAELLPAHQPRYVLYSYTYKHDDGRISYPLCFIYVCPEGCKPEMSMMYSGSLKHLEQEAGFSKVFKIRSQEDLTEEWLREKLGFFR